MWHIPDLSLQSLPRAHNHRWGLGRSSTSKLRTFLLCSALSSPRVRCINLNTHKYSEVKGEKWHNLKSLLVCCHGPQVKEMSLIRNTILECQVCGELAVLFVLLVVWVWNARKLWLSASLSQVSMSLVPAAFLTLVTKACPAWRVCTTLDTPVVPVHLEPLAMGHTAGTLMR